MTTPKAGRGRSRAPGSTPQSIRQSADEMRSLARDAALAAIARLTALSNSQDERIALAASQELLNRAFGKIGTGAEEGAGPPQQLVIKIVRFGDVDSEHPGGAA
jgi:hypothetical protein